MVNHYLTLGVSLYYLCGGSVPENGFDRSIANAGSLLLGAHILNVLALIFLLASPNELRELASQFAGERRATTLAFLFLIFAMFALWLVGALRRKVKEVSGNDELLGLVLGRWRLWATLYLVLSGLGGALAFVVAVSRH
jgi:hypothetical protein